MIRPVNSALFHSLNGIIDSLLGNIYKKLFILHRRMPPQLFLCRYKGCSLFRLNTNYSKVIGALWIEYWYTHHAWMEVLINITGNTLKPLRSDLLGCLYILNQPGIPACEINFTFKNLTLFLFTMYFLLFIYACAYCYNYDS